ncbi:protein SCO1/2 [Tistlia consotensis]|uniref:Protein SCO1/2 n=1 Tax=Tistlia consotensis USBA 355 TaxID=560819 RepID=A0A1Y6BIC8_9PROT|nr:SCO family protein [Tistlia consotensis]SMF12869.1 protein SCO1/2 [Tistlia consotensis USBA 355]SNR50860.1 protein SCO1/2 [Tistlia consotensis]
MSGQAGRASRLDRAIRWGTALLLGGALCFAGWLLAERLSQPHTLTGAGLIEERRDLGGPFRLTDQQGRERTQADFAGRVVLLYFGYSFCPDLCPLALQTMAEARDRLAEPGRVQPLFVTLDPGRDTPERLAGYMAAFGPDFVGLTGARREIDRLTRRFGVVYRLRTEVDPAFYPVDHSSRLYVMDGNWNAVAVLADKATVEQVADALRRALAEAARG